MVRHKLTAGMAMILMLLIAVPATNAQDDDTRERYSSGVGLGFGPIVGWYKARDADDGRFTGGAALRLKLSPSFAVEGSLTYRHEEYADGAIKARSWPVQVTGLLYPFPIIYGAVGAGWYNTTITYDRVRLADQNLEDQTSGEFGWHFGGGVELPLGESASLTADIRYVFLNYDFRELPGTGDTNSNFFVISAGVLFGL